MLDSENKMTMKLFVIKQRIEALIKHEIKDKGFDLASFLMEAFKNGEIFVKYLLSLEKNKLFLLLYIGSRKAYTDENKKYHFSKFINGWKKLYDLFISEKTDIKHKIGDDLSFDYKCMEPAIKEYVYKNHKNIIKKKFDVTKANSKTDVYNIYALEYTNIITNNIKWIFGLNDKFAGSIIQTVVKRLLNERFQKHMGCDTTTISTKVFIKGDDDIKKETDNLVELKFESIKLMSNLLTDIVNALAEYNNKYENWKYEYESKEQEQGGVDSDPNKKDDDIDGKKDI